MNWLFSIIYGAAPFVATYIFTYFADVLGGNSQSALFDLLKDAGQGSLGTVFLIIAIKILLNERERDQKRRDDQDAKRDTECQATLKKNDDMWRERIADKIADFSAQSQRIKALEEFVFAQARELEHPKTQTIAHPHHATERVQQ